MPTLLELRDYVRQRADQENSRFIKDAELNAYINASYLELYDLLVSRFEDYFSKTVSFTLTGGTNSYTLPTDLYKLRGLDYQTDSSSQWATLKPFNFNERNNISLEPRSLVYRMMGGSIIILPEDRAAGSYKLWYIPRLTRLSVDTDQTQDILDFEEYIVTDAAIKCVIKEESDPSALLALKSALIERVKTMAATRDTGFPEKIGDVSTYSSVFGDGLLKMVP